MAALGANMAAKEEAAHLSSRAIQPGVKTNTPLPEESYQRKETVITSFCNL